MRPPLSPADRDLSGEAAAPRRDPRGWTDRPDAWDRIQDRFDQGRITDKQAARLRTWVRDGYVVIELGTARDRVGPALMALEQIFAGVVPDARFRCPTLNPAPIAWVPELTPNAASVLDIHFLSRSARSLLLAPIVTRFLTELFNGPVSIIASEGVLRPIETALHRDSAVVDTAAERAFAGLWFGMDDPASGAAMHVCPGSHRLRTPARQDEPKRTPLAPNRGAVVVWHPDLAYETPSPTGLDVWRGIRAYVQPANMTPSSFERSRNPRWGYDRHFFSTDFYAGREPLD